MWHVGNKSVCWSMLEFWRPKFCPALIVKMNLNVPEPTTPLLTQSTQTMKSGEEWALPVGLYQMWHPEIWVVWPLERDVWPARKPETSFWLVVWTPLKNVSQLGRLFPIYGKIKHVPNHQPGFINLGVSGSYPQPHDFCLKTGHPKMILMSWSSWSVLILSIPVDIWKYVPIVGEALSALNPYRLRNTMKYPHPLVVQFN